MTDQPTPGGPLLEVRDLRVSFGPVRALDGVSLDVKKGPFGIALVGESGSGKTTAGRAVLRLVPAAPGISLYIDGPNITVPLAAGTPADFSAAASPLRLVR